MLAVLGSTAEAWEVGSSPVFSNYSGGGGGRAGGSGGEQDFYCFTITFPAPNPPKETSIKLIWKLPLVYIIRI